MYALRKFSYIILKIREKCSSFQDSNGFFNFSNTHTRVILEITKSNLCIWYVL